MAANGNGHASPMMRVFPEALTPLAQADPEVYSIIQDEKKRQWCVRLSTGAARGAMAAAARRRRWARARAARAAGHAGAAPLAHPPSCAASSSSSSSLQQKNAPRKPTAGRASS
jgi:hypothetical protein